MKDLMLLVDHRGAEVTLDGGTLRVRWPGAGPEHVPLGLLGQVVLHGNPQVELRALRALGERGVPTVLLPLRGAGEGAWLSPGLGHTIAVRVAQHRAAGTEQGLEIARAVVRGKLDAYRRLAQGLGAEASVAAIDAALDGLGTALDTETLMGLEGAGSAAWWRVLRERLDPEWAFAGRNRRPPRDPINALLSLGYTLLGSEVAVAVGALGLDPGLGFLHGIVPGRESLVLDLMEPLRAGVDAWVLTAIDAGRFTPADFQRDRRTGCRLSKAARGRFYAAWADARMDWPDPAQPGEPLPARCLHWARLLRERLGPYDPHTGAPRDG